MGEPRSRREPPRFRTVELRRREHRGPRLVRLTLAGPALAGLDPGLPAASVRVQLPRPGTDQLDPLEWNGNEFLRPDRSRPPLRTLTPLRVDPEHHELDVEVVLHDGGLLSPWASDAPLASPVAVSGTGRGYEIDPRATSFLIAGDESAIPAISTILPLLPPAAAVTVVVETAAPDGEVDLPEHPGSSVRWCDSLLDEVAAVELEPEARVWAAGEAAQVQRLRRHLFDERGFERSQAHVRGYWKAGRDGTG